MALEITGMTRSFTFKKGSGMITLDDPNPSETPRVSPCEPLCAIFLGKPSVYPLSPTKANMGRLCQRC